MPIREISTILTAKDEASDSLAAVSATGDDTADSMADVESETEAASEGLLDLDARASAAAASVAGLGTAMQSTLDSTRNTREELARASVTLGKTRGETEALAASLSDATFPVEDVSATLSTLAQTGVEGEEQMRETALAVDLLADATGTTAAEASELAPVVKALDGDLSALTDDADAFTAAANETNLELRDVTSTIERLDFQELEEMGVTSKEAAGLVALFGQETGFTGRRLRTEFRQAVEETDGDVDDLADELGLTTEQVEEFNEEIGSGTDLTEEYAEANNSTVTSMDRLRAVVDRTQLRVAGLSEGLSVAAPGLQAAGGAALVWANINTATLIPSLRAKSAALLASSAASLASVKTSLAAASAKGVLAGAGFTAAGAITALWAATGPLGLAALALTGIILGLVGVMRTDLFGAGEMAESILGRLRGGVETTVAVIRELLGIGKELGRITLTAGALGLLAPFAAVLAFFDDPQRWISAGREVPSMVASGIRDAAGEPVAAVSGMVSDVRDRLPFSPAAAGPLADLDETGPGFVSTIADGIRGDAPKLTNAAETMFEATPLGQAVGAAGGGGQTNNIDIDVTVNAADAGSPEATGQAVAETTVDELMRKLAREANR